MAYFVVNRLGTNLGNGRLGLTMELSGSGVPWSTRKIAFNGSAAFPEDAGPKTGWSAWDVSDEKGNYYGNINLDYVPSDGQPPHTGAYVKPDPAPYYLSGFHLTPGETQKDRYSLTVDEVFGVLDPPTTATPAVYPGTNQPIWLTTRDGKIVNDRGETVVLKGIARPSLEWNVNGQYLSESDIKIMAGEAWRANVLRISLVDSNFGVPGTGIVYCSHPWRPRGEGATLASNFAGVLGKYPVIFTEFGCNLWDAYDDPKDPYKDFYHHLIDYVNAHDLHYTAWGWWVESYKPPHKSGPMPGLLADWSGAPIKGGEIIKQDLNDHPGKGLGRKW